MGRQFSDWIDGFLEYTSSIRSPEVFRRWAGLSAVASALQRQVYVRVQGQTLFPNLYVLLIADPGIGKSNAIKHARGICTLCPNIKLTPTRLTQRKFYSEVEAAIRINITSPQAMEQHSSLSAMIDEFSVFVRPSAGEFMADLADIYDCPDPFDYSTQTQGENYAPKSWFNMIGGATPKYLKEAWSGLVLDQGFPARIIIVYSDEHIDVDLFSDQEITEDEEVDEEMRQRLAKDLRHINKFQGHFTWDREARDFFEAWKESGLSPVPSDPRLQHYCTRRHIHVSKLAMIISASKREDQEIIISDITEAKRLILEAETGMPKAIDPIGANALRDAMVLVRRYIETKYRRTGKAILEHELRNILISEVHPMHVPTLLQEIVNARWVYTVGEAPTRKFRPYKSEDE